MGRLPDPVFIASVALGAAMFSAIYWLFGFLRMGTTGLTAQAFGALSESNQGELVAIFIRASAIAAVLGLSMVLLQIPLTQLLFLLFDPPGDVGRLAAEYYQIRIWGAPAYLIYIVELGILFGLQKMRATLYLSVGLNVSNLALDLLLVLGFNMDVRGVALGTVISEWGAAVFGFAFVWHALTPYRQSPLQNLWQRSKVTQLLDVSANLILRTFFVQLPFLAGTILATGLGTLPLAAHAILMQLFFVMTYALDGFAHTVETLAGYYYGAKDPKNLRAACIYSTLWAAGLAFLISAMLFLFGHNLVDMFTVAEEVRQYAYEYLPWLASVPIFCVWAFLLDGIFIGTTHIREMRNAMLFSAVLWGLLLWLTFPSYEYHAVWFSMNCFMLLRGLLLGLSYPRIEQAAKVAV
ncbi:MAG: MATE family multidrug resistance protein [Limisphaerales bacterium]|jgi:MATE family multidrug resistance protein